jgi:mono/diheme cytochrome c family protein
MRPASVKPGCLTLLLFTVCVTAAQAAPDPGECPQPRFTGKAPDDYYQRANPLPPTQPNLKAGEQLFRAKQSCAMCHGTKGNGKGPLSKQFIPPPRNFTCAQTIKGIPDGQLFWIIRFGSPGTSMPANPDFSEEQIWQIIVHLRRLAS